MTIEQKVIIFDLDCTLHNRMCELGVDIVEILQDAKQNGYKIALASLNKNADLYLKRYNIIDYFDIIEYRAWDFDTCFKSDLFNSIHKKLNIPYENCILFDDSLEAIKEANNLNIKTVTVDPQTLLTKQVYIDGLRSKFDTDIRV